MAANQFENSLSQKWRVVKQAKLKFCNTNKSSKIKGSGTVQLLVKLGTENPDWEWDPQSSYRIQFIDLCLSNSTQDSLFVYVVSSKIGMRELLDSSWEQKAEQIVIADSLGGSLKGSSCSERGCTVLSTDLRCSEPMRIQSIVVAKPNYVKPSSLTAEVQAYGNLKAAKIEDKILKDKSDEKWLQLRAKRNALKEREKKLKAKADVENTAKSTQRGRTPRGPIGMPLPQMQAACKEVFKKQGRSKIHLVDFETMDNMMEQELNVLVLQSRIYPIIHQISHRFAYDNCRLDFQAFCMCASVISKYADKLGIPPYITIQDAFVHFDVNMDEALDELEFFAALGAMGYKYEEDELRTLQAQFFRWTEKTNGKMNLEYFTSCFIGMCDYEHELKKRNEAMLLGSGGTAAVTRALRESELKRIVKKEHANIQSTIEECINQIWDLHVKKTQVPENDTAAGETVASSFQVRLQAALDDRAERERKKQEAERLAKLRAEEKALKSKMRAQMKARQDLVEGMGHRRLQDKRLRLEELRENIGVDTIDLSNMFISALDEGLMKAKLGQALNNVIDINLSNNNLSEVPEALAYNLYEVVKFDCSHNHLTRIEHLKQLRDMRICKLQNNYIASIPAEIGTLENLQKLDISGNQLEVIPECIGQLENLEVLHLFNNNIREIEDDVFNRLLSLRILELQRNALEVLPDDFGGMPNLVSLDLSYNKLQFLPASIERCQSLKVLRLSHNQLEHLRPEIASLSELQFFYVESNKLTQLPIEMGSLLKLKHFDISQNCLMYLPEEVGCLVGLSDLAYLNLGRNQLQAITAELGRLFSLHTLDLTANNLFELTGALGSLSALKKLILQRNRLKELPPEVGFLTGLQELDLSYNILNSFPSFITSITELQKLSVKSNDLKLPLPDGLGMLHELSYLDLSINRIPALPSTLGSCSKLSYLDASSNCIRRIPESFTNLINLKHLDLYNNDVDKIPLHLFKMTWIESINLLKNPTKDFQFISKEQNWQTMSKRHLYYSFAVRAWRKNSDEYNSGKFGLAHFLLSIANLMGTDWDEDQFSPLCTTFYIKAKATRISPQFDFMCRQI